MSKQNHIEVPDSLRFSIDTKEVTQVYSKKNARQESKRKKLAALIAVSKLNIDEKPSKDMKALSSSTSANLDEPCCKKLRKNDYVENNDSNDYVGNNDSNDYEKESVLDIDTLKKEYNKIRVHNPKLQLRAAGFQAYTSRVSDERVPLMLTDVQHLLLNTVLGNPAPYNSARWYKLEKCQHVSQTTCLVIEGISLQNWSKNRSCFTAIDRIFPEKIEILTPSVYNGSLIDELAVVPLSEADKESLEAKYGTMDVALETRKDLMVMMKAVFPVKNELNDCNIGYEDKFSRLHLMLSAWQLIEENYPVPLKGKLKNMYSGYVMTQDVYTPVTSKSPMFGLDCEMCITNVGSELTRVSVVNETHDIVYETYVKPYNTITNYLTQYSGVTKSVLKDITVRLEDVQNDLKKLLPPDAILVGQSLNIDLHALKMMHPYIIDTSVIFNITGERSRKSKLKVLVKEFLNENIQMSGKGHCSVEDSLASLKLVQLKLSKSIDFGDAVFTGKIRFKERTEKQNVKQYASTIFNHIIEHKKTSIIIGCDDITGDYHTYMTQANEFLNTQAFIKKRKPKKVKLSTVDKQNDVIERLSESVSDHNFAMGHLKLQKVNVHGQLQEVDGWIERIWQSLPTNALFVVVFGGTANDNGIAMVKIKN